MLMNRFRPSYNTQPLKIFFFQPLFRVFFQSACDVPEPEEKFNIDEYSDMVTLSKPVIYMSTEEIINTHSVNFRPPSLCSLVYLRLRSRPKVASMSNQEVPQIFSL